MFKSWISEALDALVGVSAHLAGINQVKGALRLKPLVEQVTHKPFAQLDFGRLDEPSLRHV